MPDYNLHDLDPRTFQQLIQAIAIREVAPGVTVYGDGADGARDATFEGKMEYPSPAEPWDGYLVVQVKFQQKTSGDSQRDGAWACKHLKTDLNKFIENPSKYRPPDYYLFVTNVDLTPVPNTGTEAQVRRILTEYAPKLGLKGYDIWDGNKIRRHIDNHRDIGRTYGGYITTGDVLAKMQAHIEGLQPNFDHSISEYLQGELIADQYARLREAGSAAERRTPLARVFVDIPAADIPHSTPTDLRHHSTSAIGFVKQTIHAASLRMDRKSILERQSTMGARETGKTTPEDGRIVLIGGPGQGKSTLGQFVCQSYRAAILKDRPRDTLSETALDALEIFLEQCKKDNFELPTSRRFPVRIDLKTFADNLAKGECKSIIDHISQKIDSRSGQPVNRNDLQKWLAVYPWLLILDGLDEVPASGNRSEVLDCIAQFSTQCATRGSDLLIIATSRPQGYGDAFEARLYCHRYLLALSAEQALNYSRRLVEACHPADPTLRNDIMTRLERAAKRPTTERLMTTPLQVTILAVLAELSGDLPDDRWELFRNYYRTIFDRETQRGIAPLSTVLSKHRRAIERIHKRVGLQLQVDSEIAGKNNATLSHREFVEIIEDQLTDYSSDDQERTLAINQLAKAALDRLVFLVSPHGDEIGFEIRSLQEYKAAEALMEGTDDQIRKRLAAIAPFPYWRNVFLFAAGKCASEREYLLSDIINLCQILSDQSNPAASLTMAGSRLALDLLEDDTFRDHPKQHRALAHIALKLLELPPEDDHVRLAKSLRPNRGLEEIYEQAISRNLLLKGIDHQLASWRTLLNSIPIQPTWATALAEREWPKDHEDQLQIFRTLDRTIASTWLLSKCITLIPKVDPHEVISTFQGFIDIKESPPWLRACRAVFQGNEYKIIPLRITNELDSPLHFELPSAAVGERAEKISELASIPNPAGDWLPLVAYARTVREPTKEVFARELIWLSESNWPFSQTGVWLWIASWPFSACLRAAQSKEHLKEIAHKLLAAESTGPDQHQELERKWAHEGVFLDQLASKLNDTNFSMDYAWAYFSISINPQGRTALADSIHTIIEKQKSLSPKTESHQIRRNLSSVLMSAMESADRALGKGSLKHAHITPEQLKEWISDSQFKWLSATLLPAFIDPEDLENASNGWLDMLDWLGRSDIVLHSPLGRDSFIKYNFLSTWIDALAKAYQRNPEKIGILKWLAAFSSIRFSANAPLQIPVTNLEKMEARYQDCAIFTLLAQGGLQETVAMSLARITARCVESVEWLNSPYMVRQALRRKMNERWVSTFLVEALRASPRNSRFKGMGISLLNEILAETKSPLHIQNRIAELGLGDIVRVRNPGSVNA